MSRTAEIVLRDTLGNLQLQIIHQTAALEAAQERIEVLEINNPPAPEAEKV